MTNHTRLTGLALMLCVAGLNAGCATAYKGAIDWQVDSKLLGAHVSVVSTDLDFKAEWDVEEALTEIGGLVVKTVKFVVAAVGLPLPTADGG